ncbi:MAG: tRNA pseudouridine(55) synthase TruB [Patescibacteria group bacterium]
MIIAINKPKGPTSFDIVAQVRKITKVKKVGHAGTLDPLASGVLVVAIGRDDTKKINLIVEKEKEYVADIRLGRTSATDDEEGEKSVVNNNQPDELEIIAVLQKFIGEIDQVPPQFSAIKINGRPAYKSARAGRVLEMKPRRVLIKQIELLNYKYPDLKIRVVTGPGVYIRSLARDIGNRLKTGAYMSGLIRTRVGEYKLEDCTAMENIKNYV